jgi:hypothetical protein
VTRSGIVSADFQIKFKLCRATYCAMSMLESHGSTMMKFSIAPAFSAALLLALICLQGTAVAQVGQIGEATGTIEISRGGQIADGTVATPIFLNDQVTTGPASSSTINLNGGSALELGESTTLKIDEHLLPPNQSYFKSRVSLLRGTVRSVVPRVLAKADFEVHTPNAVTSVRGTDFRVAFSSGQKRFGYPGCTSFTDLTVYTGVVTVANLADLSVTVDVPEGFATTVACDQAPEAPGPAGLGESGSGGVSGPGGGVAPPPPASSPPLITVPPVR